MYIKKGKITITTLTMFALLIFFIMTNCQSDKENGKNETGENKQENLQPGTQDDIGQSAQTGEVSPAEVETFITIVQKLRPMQRKFQMQAAQLIQQSELGMQKYRAIAQSMQNPNAQGQQDFSQEDLDSYQQIAEKLEVVQQDLQAESEEIIKEEGLSAQRYQQIGQISRTDTVLQQRLRNEFESRQKEMPQQPQMQQPAPQ
jgi:hypothetical protein